MNPSTAASKPERDPNRAAELEFAGLRVWLGERWVLDGFDLRFQPGELVAIVGPSGCGKTTLLRTIAGLVRATEGRLSIDGVDAAGLSPRERNIGLVFQDLALYPHLTVRGNLDFPLRSPRRWFQKTSATRLNCNQRGRRVDEIAELLKIGLLLDRYPSSLSGGERQRVAIGRAIVRRPRILLFDEPLSQLDNHLRYILRDELVAAHRTTGATTLYVTHDLTEATAIAQRMVVIQDGRVIQDGTPEEIYTNPNQWWIGSSFGDPPMNRLPARVAAATIQLGEQTLPIDLRKSLADGSSLWVAFRPADVSLQDELLGDQTLRFSATVERTYRRDERIVVVASHQQQKLSTLVPLGASFSPGEALHATIRYESLLFFDSADRRIFDGR